VSVCRLAFGSATQAERTRGGLHDAGVHVLPCAQFHWARPQEGARLLRLALARDTTTMAEALRRLAIVSASVAKSARPDESGHAARPADRGRIPSAFVMDGHGSAL